jgi:hypothetical protein
MGLRLHVLLIRPWTHRVDPVRAALHGTGFELHITRVDIEPALHAALSRRRFDLVIHDPSVPGITRDLIEAHLRERRHATPIVTLGDLAALADAVRLAIAAVLN